MSDYRKLKKTLKGVSKKFGGLKPWQQGGILILALILAAQFGPWSTIYSGGWEVRTGIESVTVNSETYTQSNQPLEMYQPWGDKYLKFDVDEPTRGVANLVVDVGPPREYVNDRGVWRLAGSGETFDHIEKVVGEQYFFWDHHVFLYEIRVTAEPDFEPGVIAGVGEWGEATALWGAQKAKVAVRMYFETDPWVNRLVDTFEGETGNYTLDTDSAWSAVMSASVFQNDAGWVGDSAGSGGTYVADNTGQLNTFISVNIDDAPTNPIGAPSVVGIDVSGELFPGWEVSGFIFAQTAMYPTYFWYKIRVDVLTTAGYNLESGKMDDELEDIIYEQSFGVDVFGNLAAWLGDLLFGGITGIIVLVVIALVLVYLFKRVLSRGGNK